MLKVPSSRSWGGLAVNILVLGLSSVAKGGV